MHQREDTSLGVRERNPRRSGEQSPTHSAAGRSGKYSTTARYADASISEAKNSRRVIRPYLPILAPALDHHEPFKQDVKAVGERAIPIRSSVSVDPPKFPRVSHIHAICIRCSLEDKLELVRNSRTPA
eukprot:scaffold42852_cov29-Tisochrysis_lutea.AAC.4